MYSYICCLVYSERNLNEFPYRLNLAQAIIGHVVTILICRMGIYRIYSHNLRTFFPSLAAEKSGRVKYADFFVEVLIWVLF
jgi:hypothetical protein